MSKLTKILYQSIKAPELQDLQLDTECIPTMIAYISCTADIVQVLINGSMTDILAANPESQETILSLIHESIKDDGIYGKLINDNTISVWNYQSLWSEP